MGWTIRGSIHGRSKEIFVFQNMQTGFGAYPASWSLGTAGWRYPVLKGSKYGGKRIREASRSAFLSQHYEVIRSMAGETGAARCTYGNLIWKTGSNRPHGRPARRWKGVDRFYRLRIGQTGWLLWTRYADLESIKFGNFLTSWETISF